MPREVFGAEYPFLRREEILSFEEIARLAQVFRGLGVAKLRLTGGEPLLRRDLPALVRMLSAADGSGRAPADLALTTNGALLAEQALALRAAGLRRLTVSLDSLDPARFAQMADTTVPLERVLRGIETARGAGFEPIKVNMVVKRGVNEEDLVPMARQFGREGFILRFIEFMDVGNANGWRLEQVVTASEMQARLAEEFALEPLPPNYGGEVARRFRTRAGGEIGIISSVTQPFCGNCTRARLSADGRLFLCLFATTGYDLRGPIRAGASDEELRAIIGKVWGGRGDRYSELRHEATAAPQVRGRKAEMSLLGG